MHSTAIGPLDDDGDDGLPPDLVATVDDGFERGAAYHGLWISVRSRALRSGRVTAVCAGVTVDLREATLCPDGATLYVQSALSGIDVLVPADWDVACDVDAIDSGVGEHRPSANASERRPRLRIQGMVVAGGLSVR